MQISQVEGDYADIIQKHKTVQNISDLPKKKKKKKTGKLRPKKRKSRGLFFQVPVEELGERSVYPCLCSLFYPIVVFRVIKRRYGT